MVSSRLIGVTVLCPCPLLSTVLTQEDRKTPWHDYKIANWDIKHQHKQIEKTVGLSVLANHFPDVSILIS